MPTLTLLQGDITQENVDAIVNAANSSLMGGGGVDGAIHRAGGPAILAECRQIIAKIGNLPTGEAVLTGGGRLAAKHVIHAVGPRWRGGSHGEPRLLEKVHREAMTRAKEAGLTTISFPAISTGIYGYPVDLAAPLALATVWSELASLGANAEARFVLFDPATLAAFEKAAGDVLPAGSWSRA